MGERLAGASVSAVVRRHGLTPQQLSSDIRNCCPYQLSHPAVFVVQAAQQRDRYDWSNRLHGTT